MRLIFCAVIGLACLLSSLTAFADETCVACDKKVLVTGQFEHRRAWGVTTIQGETWRGGDAFREEIFGTNFTVSVSGLPAGRYTAIIGLAEVDFTNAGQRVFDITCGDQVLASNLDIIAAAGGAGKVYFVSNFVDHAEESNVGPLTLNFIGRVNDAKLNSFDLRDSDKQTIVSIRAADLLNVGDTKALTPPVVAGPVIWKDPSQTLDARVNDLISRMSLAEKVQQMRNTAPGIPRLGLPAYNYWSECLHGVARSGIATVFPQAIGMAATWDPALAYSEAHVIAVEARAKNNEYRQAHHDDSAQYYGLHFWTPNINIFRDPRWGRGQETYGEDPFLTGRLGVSFIQGLQGDDPHYLEAYACAKHYAVHSGPDPLRHTFDVEPPERDLYETYLPQFEAAVREGHVGGVMGAYNSVNGKPACANPFLLTDLLRNQWGFDGYVTSDCGAIFDIWANHHYVDTPEQAAAAAVKAGDDLCCGTDYDALARAVQEGLITQPEIDNALALLLKTRFRLGLFDPPSLVAYDQIPPSENNTPAHEALALQVARESMVLLKNDGLLPLDRRQIKRIAVIGANADSVGMLLGNYNGTPSNPVTILEGIRMIAGPNIEVTYERGCSLATHTNDVVAPDKDFTNAINAAAQADVVIYVGGIDAHLEGEEMRVYLDGFNGGDRTRIELPPVQENLLKALQATGKRVVYVNCSGSAMAMPWENEYLNAILQAWYPGEEGGRAVAETLFGENNPAGRLPVTFYQSTADLPDFENYSMSNRTYRYFSGKPVFAFGHGLSYTTFRYRHAKLASKKIDAGQDVTVSFELKNTGDRDGDEVAQVYFRHVNSAVPQPQEALCGFQRVHLAKGESKEITIDIPAERLRYWDTITKQYVVEPGKYQLLVAAASDDLRAKLPFTVSGQSITISAQ
ncbi:MAG TPA: glycoside hydrolase family 3 C-terminal domain-containing protein [Verrucomicrobiae bacterium]|jgi:beta-glucosidase